jgi:hypothetical protein
VQWGFLKEVFKHQTFLTEVKIPAICFPYLPTTRTYVKEYKKWITQNSAHIIMKQQIQILLVNSDIGRV